MIKLTQEHMKEYKTTSCLCLAATTNTILSTYEMFLSWTKGKGSSEPPDIEILDTLVLFTEKSL